MVKKRCYILIRISAKGVTDSASTLEVYSSEFYIARRPSGKTDSQIEAAAVKYVFGEAKRLYEAQGYNVIFESPVTKELYDAFILKNHKEVEMIAKGQLPLHAVVTVSDKSRNENPIIAQLCFMAALPNDANDSAIEMVEESFDDKIREKIMAENEDIGQMDDIVVDFMWCPYSVFRQTQMVRKNKCIAIFAEDFTFTMVPENAQGGAGRA